jgi:RNA polymerase sigma-70 factor (ECF subfamily)
MSAVTAFRVNKKLTDSEFDQLFRENRQLVFNTAFGVTGSAEDAEDVLQTVFLRLMRREFPLDRDRNLPGYLYRAAFNLAVDIVRKRPRQVLTSEAERFEDVVTRQEAAIAEERERQLYDAIKKLHPAAAQILMLRYVDRRSLADIADLLKTTRSTVAVSLFRSRSRLRKLIRAVGEES